MLKVAVVGAGHIGHTHARCYRDHAKTELVAVCDAVPEKAQAFADAFGVRAYHSVADLLQNEELGAVSIATAGVENGSHHFEPTMQCLEARVPVLCEKPISNDIGEARQMVTKSRELKVPLGINLNHRFTPAAARLKQMQNDGEVGEVLWVNMALWFLNPNDPPPYQHIRALHPHSIDVMRFFGGDIQRVQCFMLRAPGKSSSWSTLAMNVQFASGAVGHLTGSQDMSWNHAIERCEVGGSRGRAVIANVFERLEWYPREDKATQVWNNGIFGGMGEFDDTFKIRIDAFVNEVLSGDKLTASGEDGLAAQEVIEAAIRSHENGTIEDVHQND